MENCADFDEIRSAVIVLEMNRQQMQQLATDCFNLERSIYQLLESSGIGAPFEDPVKFWTGDFLVTVNPNTNVDIEKVPTLSDLHFQHHESAGEL
jgi:hypothetical protein